MKNLVKVVMESTHAAGLQPLYERQLSDAGIPYAVETITPYPMGLMHPLGPYIANLRKYLDKHGDCENFIVTDAWDMLFYGTAAEVANKVPDNTMLFGAERNCWPSPYLSSAYKGKTPWKFLNAGFWAGKPNVFSSFLDEIEQHPSYHPAYMDQHWLGERYLDRTLYFEIDEHTRLNYCMYLESGEMQPQYGKPYNIVTQQYPHFIHFNGKVEPSIFLWKMANCTKELVTN